MTKNTLIFLHHISFLKILVFINQVTLVDFGLFNFWYFLDFLDFLIYPPLPTICNFFEYFSEFFDFLKRKYKKIR